MRKAVTLVGRRKDIPVLVLGSSMQINAYGEIIPEGDRFYIWMDETVLEGLSSVTVLEGLSSVTLEEVLPNVRRHLDTSVLYR